MKMMTVSEVSKSLNVSTRMLRYYEKIGLLSSQRKEGYAYRIYDSNAVRRLQQIIIFRKLHIPLKQIAVILDDDEQLGTLQILQERICELDEEINAASVIRDIMKAFFNRLDECIRNRIHLDLLGDSEIIHVANALCLSKINLKEECSMNDLNKANECMDKKLNVRMVLLPPCTVASYHYIGENPEETVGDVMDKFIRECNLYEIKPDARMFGFNHPSPSEHRAHYGYEDWVTIPENMELSAPITKKYFEEGLYAALTIDFPNFHEWKLLTKWVEESELYIANYSELGEEIMGGCLEEHLNWVYASQMGWPENGIDGKIDLLMPIKRK